MCKIAWDVVPAGRASDLATKSEARLVAALPIGADTWLSATCLSLCIPSAFKSAWVLI
jgi:hypothetical protein